MIVVAGNDVGVVDERPAVELSAEDGIVDVVGRGDALSVHLLLAGSLLPAQIHVRAYAAIIHFAERRPHRHAATEDFLIPCQVAYELHTVAHNLAARLVVSGYLAAVVQEVELDHVEAPIVKHGVEYLLEIGAHVGIINIQRVKAAPVVAAADGLALSVAQQPIGVLSRNLGILMRGKRRKPQSRFNTGGVQSVCNPAHTALKRRLERQPVADIRLIAVVYLEDIYLRARGNE